MRSFVSRLAHGRWAAMSRRRRKTYRIWVQPPRPDACSHGNTYIWVNSYLAFSREMVNKLLDLPNTRVTIAHARRSLLISVADWYWQNYQEEILTSLAIDISHPWEMCPSGYRVHLTQLQSRGDAKVYIMNDGVTLKHIR